MTFEDFLNKSTQEKAPEVEKVPQLALDGIEMEVVDTAPVEEVEVEIMPMVPKSEETKGLYNTLDMYKKIDPEFARSVMSWD